MTKTSNLHTEDIFVCDLKLWLITLKRADKLSSKVAHTVEMIEWKSLNEYIYITNDYLQ